MHQILRENSFGEKKNICDVWKVLMLFFFCLKENTYGVQSYQ